MTVEVLDDQGKRDSCGGNMLRKKIRSVLCKKKLRRRCSSQAATAAVSLSLQRLYLACIDVFKGFGMVPDSSDVHKLCDIIDDIVPEDFGLSRDLQFFKTRSSATGSTRVTCTTVYKCQKFSLNIFFLPANAVIPLHNHPDMTVFSKLLLGKVHIKAYDLVDPVDASDSLPPSQLKLARMKANGIFTAPCKTSVLYPTTGGNIHAFTAITPCAMLDVIGTPFSKDDGRDCTYYKDIPYADLAYGGEGKISDEERQLYAWLEEIEMPKESEMDGIEYLGPQIIEM